MTVAQNLDMGLAHLVLRNVAMTLKAVDQFEFEGFYGPNGFDDCIIGKDYHTGRPVYCIEKIISQLMQTDNAYKDDKDGATEHFDCNIAGTRIDQEPIWVWMGENYE